MLVDSNTYLDGVVSSLYNFFYFQDKHDMFYRNSVSVRMYSQILSKLQKFFPTIDYTFQNKPNCQTDLTSLSKICMPLIYLSSLILHANTSMQSTKRYDETGSPWRERRLVGMLEETFLLKITDVRTFVFKDDIHEQNHCVVSKPICF